jgi:hypothetical protein
LAISTHCTRYLKSTDASHTPSRDIYVPSSFLLKY